MDRLLFCALALAMALLPLAPSESDANNYGDFSSPTGTVAFNNVADLNGLYGAPTVSVNTLDFNPTLFELDCSSSATNCDPSVSVADTLTFDIEANSGFFIEEILLTEAGDTLVNDFNQPTASAFTSLVGNVFVDVYELDSSPANGINGNAQMVFTPGDTFNTAVDGNVSLIWTGELLLNIDDLITGSSQTGKATGVTISLENILTGFAENNAVAQIEKKDADGLAITVIPEPGTALLLALGLAGLSLAGHRRPESTL
jgi:hypothetical protein